MEFVADLHLHSKYSRAVSQNMVLPEMARWAIKKGINLLTTSDFTHPLWFREIKNQLDEAGEGVYKMRDEKLEMRNDVRFILTTEIASIYKQGDKLRRIHNLVFSPGIETAEKINKALLARGCNLSSDGRPIIGLSSKNLLELLLNIDKKIILIPCHAWTPHFGVFGSASGFDSIKESFEDLSNYIYGIETGISSDPWMNWQIPELENRSILSFSDAHSLPKMGREATVFKIDKTLDTLTYDDVGKAIVSQMKMKDEKWKMKNDARIAYTIEFYPEEGKYHYTGHRNCKVIKSPQQIKRDGNICPVCSRRLTEGVMYRVQQVARSSKFKIQNSKLNENGVFWIEDPEGIHPPFVKLVPLNEIIAESMEATVQSEKVKIKFDEMCLDFGSELNILLKTPLSDISLKFGEKVAQGVEKVRRGDIFIDPGYDGEYGKVKIWQEKVANNVKIVNSEAQLGLKF
ncbi:MAG: DNA helicase UvrD [Candidatus Levybacteria bacterium]|nr:DNA helicase UvrD [Candidatus Levybacteria bacterium]